jgi:endonuclease III related protein
MDEAQDANRGGHADARLRQLLTGLEAAFGQLAWWPAETPFEVMVGAVLTQNTAWVNVERAIGNLKAAGVLDAAGMLDWPEATLAEAIRPSGYFNVKAKRLRAACRWWLEHAARADSMVTPDLRASLLAVHGIGPETADDILLYAFARPVFVVDAYTRRLFARFGLPHHDAPYDRLRQWVEVVLGPDVPALKQLHALIVELAKDTCRPKPRCGACPLADTCPRHGVP